MTGALLTAQELAEQLGVPLATLYQWNTKGTGPKRIRMGRHVRYRLSDVDAWLDRQAVGEGRVA